MDKAGFAYPNFISQSINIFEPGKFIQRANVAADDYLNLHGGINDTKIERLRLHGIEAVIKTAQAKLVDAGVVLTPEAVDRVFSADP